MEGKVLRVEGSIGSILMSQAGGLVVAREMHESYIDHNQPIQNFDEPTQALKLEQQETDIAPEMELANDEGKVLRVEGSIGSILMSQTGGLVVAREMQDSYLVDNKDRPSFEEQIQTLKLEQQTLKKQQEIDIAAEMELARKEGYALGYSHGEVSGKAEVLSQNKNKIEQANQFISSISEALEKKARDQSQMISEAISDALIKSFFLASSVDKESILSITNAAMEALPVYAKTITINCSASDFAIVSECNANIPVKVNDSLKPGEVVIDSDVGLVRLTGESITEKLLDKILEER